MKRLKAFIGVLILGFLIFFLTQINVVEALLIAKEIGFGFVWILLVSFIAYWFGMLAWKVLLKSSFIKSWPLFRIKHIGEMLSLINPTSIVAGDGIKYYFLKKRHSNPTELLSSILISRVLIITSFVLLSNLTLLLYFFSLEGQYRIVLIPVLIITLLIAWLISQMTSDKLLLAEFYKKAFRDRLKFFYHRKVHASLLRLNRSISNYYKKDKNLLLISGIYSLLHWLFGALEYFVILKLLHFDISFLDALFLECGVMLIKNMLLFIPGQIGVEELANKMFLNVIGVPDPSLWVSVSIIRRVRQIFWLAVGVLFYFQWKKESHENFAYHT